MLIPSFLDCFPRKFCCWATHWSGWTFFLFFFSFSFLILGWRWHLSCPQKLIGSLCNKAVISYAIKTSWCMSKLIIWLAINRAINEWQLLVSSYILILQLPNELSRLSGEETRLRKTHFTAREIKFPHLILMSPPAVFKTFSSTMTRLSWGVRMIWAARGSQMWLSSVCKAPVPRTGILYSEPTQSPAPCLLLLCNFDSIPIWQQRFPRASPTALCKSVGATRAWAALTALLCGRGRKIACGSLEM